MSKTEFVMVIDQPTAEMIDAAQAIKRGKYETVCPERVQIVERYKAMVLLSPKPEDHRPFRYFCASCNEETNPPEPYKAYVVCKCGSKTSATCAAALASAGPSASAIHPINMKTMMQAYAQVDHKALLHGTSNWCASMATALRGVIHSEPSAPVEIDHDALVAAVCVLRSQGLGNLSAAVEEARAALEHKT